MDARGHANVKVVAARQSFPLTSTGRLKMGVDGVSFHTARLTSLPPLGRTSLIATVEDSPSGICSNESAGSVMNGIGPTKKEFPQRALPGVDS